MDDVVDVFVFRDQRDNLRLREHRAGARDRNVFFISQPAKAHIIQRHFHRARHHVKEPAGSGRALVIHYEIRNFSRAVQCYNLAVLPADINDRADRRIEKMRASRVAGDLCDTAVGIPDRCPAVSGCHDAADVRPRKAGLLQRRFERFFRADDRTGAGRQNDTCDIISILIQNHDIRARGARINACHIGEILFVHC